MTKLRVSFSVDIENPPAGITQVSVQAMVDSLLVDCTDGRYPYMVETLQMAVCNIVYQSISDALHKHFRERYEDRRVFTDRDGREGYSYLAGELTERRLAKSKPWVRLHRKYDENDD